MLVKILGVFDLFAGFMLFALSFNLIVPKIIILFVAIVLLIKGAFILSKSIASGFDLFGAVVLLLSLSFSLPKFLFIIPGLLILQKGFFSLVA